ncbi:hypothetical protein [Micromonospora vulcania]|uniref:Polyketide cyclase / dehydrase and lipid transport n=1 Tax=Micromonospora vulcania TaxID=1441873 RepID=A0ABW1HD29_9ACTN
MRDADLVGLWDSGPYDYGSMESSWLCLRGNGTGWTAWANAAGGASVSQLTWSCPHEAELELRYTWTASGTGFPGTPPTFVEVDEEGPDDALVRTRYLVRIDTPPLSQVPAVSLDLQESVEFARRFALVTRDPTDPDSAGPPR